MIRGSWEVKFVNRILITAGSNSFTATLYQNGTASAIFNALPLESQVKRWGDEIYFSIPTQLDESQDARQEMHVGELGYWPSGNAFCIFFGRTPASMDNQPRAYSNVNPFGQVDGDVAQFRSIQDGERIADSRL